LYGSVVQAQKVVATGGNYFENANSSLSWTIGEPVIATLIAADNIITQGFHQSFVIDIQQIPLPLGWSIFSTYIDPFVTSVPVVLGQLNYLIIAKDGDGNVYWPVYGVDNIINMTIGKGYQVKMAQAETLTVKGIAVIPEEIGVYFPINWSIVGYLRDAPAPIEQMLSPLVSNIKIVKNGAGVVYWPEYGVDDIENMMPGEGYQVKMLASCILYYPPNSAPVFKSIAYYTPVYYTSEINTGNNMTLCIPDYAWIEKPASGDEIGVFGEDGQLAGSAVYQGAHTIITIWGKEEIANENKGLSDGKVFNLRLWCHTSGNETELEVAQWKEGNSLFETNGISVVEKFRTYNLQGDIRLSPNPASKMVRLDITLDSDKELKVSLYNNLSEKIREITNKRYTAGNHSISFDVTSLSAGLYFLEIIQNNSSITKKLDVVH
jgi:hypothetical protein